MSTTSTPPASSNGHGRLGPTAPGPEEVEREANPVGALGSIPGRLVRGLTRAVGSRVPQADVDERDPDFIRDALPGMWMLSTLWFRGEVRGLGNIADHGPVLCVGNHSGGNMTPDTWVFATAFWTYFGVERRTHQLAHNLVVSAPGLGFLRKFGTMAASQKNARKALDAGSALLVYPGGDYEVHRPSWERHRVDFDGRKGFIKLALEKDVPIVPVVSIGGQETALFLSRGEGLAKALRLDRIARLKVLPLSLALPWGLNVGDFGGHLPLPAKIVVEVLPPIDVRAEFGDDPDLDEVYEHVTRTMQDTLDALAAERRLPVLG